MRRAWRDPRILGPLRGGDNRQQALTQLTLLMMEPSFDSDPGHSGGFSNRPFLRVGRK